MLDASRVKCGSSAKNPVACRYIESDFSAVSDQANGPLSSALGWTLARSDPAPALG